MGVMSARLRPLVALVAVAAAGGALGGYFGLRAAGLGAGSSSHAGPPARTGAAMAYDAATESVVMFGGQADGGALADTWTWDGSNWTQQHPATSPSARAGALMAYDPESHGVILVGGANYPTTIVGVACAEPGIAVPQPAPALGQIATPAPAPLTTSAPVLPRPTNRGAPVPPSRCPKTTPQPGVGPQQDTWRWDGGNWHRVGTAPASVSRGIAQLVTEPVRGTVLLLTAAWVQPQLGRACPLLAPADVTIACPPIAVRPAYTAYTLGASGWVRIAAPPAPDPGFGFTTAALVVDPGRGRVSFFEQEPQKISVCGQVPTLPAPAPPEATSSGGGASGRAGTAVPGALPCRQPERGDVKPALCCAGRVVAWTGSRWEAAGQFGSGPSLMPPSLVGDEATHSVVYVDEQGGATWAWAGKWTRLHPAHHPASTGATAAYDAKHGQVVLFGGFAGSGVTPLSTVQSFAPSWSDQTWTWDGTDWTQRTGSRSRPALPSPIPTFPSIEASPPAASP